MEAGRGVEAVKVSGEGVEGKESGEGVEGGESGEGVRGGGGASEPYYKRAPVSQGGAVSGGESFNTLVARSSVITSFPRVSPLKHTLINLSSNIFCFCDKVQRSYNNDRMFGIEILE